MSEEKSRVKLILYAILVLILLFGLIRIFVPSSGPFFTFEIICFVVLLVLTIIGFIFYAHHWGERVLFFVFLLYLVNLAFIWFFFRRMYVVLLIIALVGFLMSVPKKISFRHAEESFSEEEPHSMVFDQPPTQPAVETSVQTAKADPAKKVKAKHSPGKFVASKNSNVYHEPKCDWAKRIHKNRRLWFKSKEAAWEHGYKAHSCVE